MGPTTRTTASTLQPLADPLVGLELDSPELAATYEQVSIRQFNHGKLLIGELGIGRGYECWTGGAAPGGSETMSPVLSRRMAR